MSDSLNLLKKELARSGSAELLDASGQPIEEIGSAKTLHLTKLNKDLPLNDDTIYSVDGTPVKLIDCFFAWVNKDLSRTEFLESAEKQNVMPLGFIQRSDLCQWLEGTKGEFEFSSNNEEAISGDADVSMVDTVPAKSADPFLEAVLSHERNIVDHNTSLRGGKDVDFTNAAERCKRSYLMESKSKSKSSKADTPAAKKSKHAVKPIILISPSASALLTMANVKAFLENGTYIDPNTSNPVEREQLSSETLATVTHTFPHLGRVTFTVVNNTDKFTREEHWERTVAVFTTGQTWQFKHYRWPTPSELFQRVKGYYFYFERDPVPQNVKEWNVERVALDKHKRFKDAVVLNAFWDSLEKSLVARGFRA